MINYSGGRQYNLPCLQLVRGDRPSVCRPYKQKELLCENAHSIEIFPLCYMPEHTAFLRLSRRPCFKSFRNSRREPIQKSEKPPPAQSAVQTSYINVTQAADVSQFCEVGRSFFVCGHRPRCRSPPIEVTQ